MQTQREHAEIVEITDMHSGDHIRNVLANAHITSKKATPNKSSANKQVAERKIRIEHTTISWKKLSPPRNQTA